jgi:hypothetical protein
MSGASSSPFRSAPLPEQGFFGRLLGRVNTEALLAEVETLLAEAGDWAAVSRGAVAAIEAKYDGALATHARSEAVLLVCRAADNLTPQQVVEGGAMRLRALAQALDIGSAAETVVQSRALAALGEAAQILIADGELGEADRAAFAKAAEGCGLAPDAVGVILRDAVTARMKDEIAHALADHRLTAEEEARIDALGHALSAKLHIDDQMADALHRARRLWQVEEGAIEPVASPIALPKTEVCLFAGYGQVMEPRSRGSKTFTHSYGAGDIVLTTKRIIFNGGDKNIAVRLNTVVDYEAFDDGVEVRRATGKPLTFALNAKDEWFARLFARARRDAG